MKQASRIRDNKRRHNLIGDALQQLRSRQKEASKKYRERKKLERMNNKQSSYKSRQSFGKAVKRVTESLPKDTNKCISVIRHIAQELNIIPKTTSSHKREQRSLPNDLKKLVIEFYHRDDISYQLPGKRDCISIKDDNGNSTTVQKRILLLTIREAYQLFLTEYDNANTKLSLTSFYDLRPLDVLLQSHMSHRNCLCSYHENVNLLIKPLSKYIRCPGLKSLQEFSAALVCCETDENCMFGRCSLCENNFNNNIAKYVIDSTQVINWYQWVLKDGYSRKVEFNGTVEDCLAILKSKIGQFLTHVFIKRQQASYFEKMKTISNNEIICLQIDFSENFRIDVQDSIQSAYFSKNAVSLITCYAWCSNIGYSFVYVLDNLTHDKYCISTALEHLFSKLKQQCQQLKEIHVFSDGATQQFKQKYLFRNLCRLAEDFQIELSWNFFATSHGKGVVDGIGGTGKRFVYKAVLSGQQCRSAADFVKIAQSKTSSINFFELEESLIEQSKTKMEPIFQSTRTVPETKKIHSVKVIGNNTIEYKYYSNSSTKKTYRFSN
ncbi:unnamed protein product [Adineta steineri]|uniref:Uncharacterized protein n=1 Tax=Adineta steineri TaxID=433720 RepID=A0A819CVR8_9BILA|nr:unnamed protein product [Adineta steineri]CAF1190648.1 unnamed protein product [Adineta steineri]CAF1357375.1 unnamed protein product [Adineta steineri]CAF1587586.1 unnamed protein product [Adineta steineri]CAF3826137.1 unnamed protein product [Adineta steineri]